MLAVFQFFPNIKLYTLGAGEVALWFRVLVALLVEHLSLVPSTLTAACNASIEGI